MRTGKLFFCLAVTVLLLTVTSVTAGDVFSGLFGKGIKGSGDIKTVERDLPPFTSIESHGAFDVTAVAGPTQKVTLTFDDNLLELIETEVDDGILYISCDESYRSRHNCRVEITIPELESVATYGSGDIEVSGFAGERFACHTHGSGDVALQNIESAELLCRINGSGDIAVRDFTGGMFECQVHGSGDVEADGKAEKIDVRIAGSGDVNLRRLPAADVNVLVQGSGDAAVRATDSFRGRVHGSGDIVCYGRPEYTSHQVHGSGDIHLR